MELKVFLLENHEGTREALSILLRGMGHKVFSYAHPAECPLCAVPQCTCPAQSPCMDLLITANRIGGMSGIQFIRKQQEKGCKGIRGKKAIISGGMSPEDCRAAADLDCRIFSKPLKYTEFSAWIRECEKSVDPGRVLTSLIVAGLTGMLVLTSMVHLGLA